MKQITLILTLLITLTLTSCDNVGKATNSTNCKDRFDVKLTDGAAMWIYDGKISDGYVKGNDEMGHRVFLPLSQISLITIVECNNRR